MFRQQQKSTYKPRKGQIHGSKKPAMLAGQRRRNAVNPKKLNSSGTPRQTATTHAEPFINIDLSHANWTTLIFLLILIPGALANSRTTRIVMDGIRVHDQGVELLPRDIHCTHNSVGISGGEICQFEGTTHYLKLFKPDNKKNPAQSNQLISLEEYNRQFAKNNIGIEVAESKFYKKSIHGNKIYIGSKKIDDLMFTRYGVATNKKLGKAGVAKWAVAATFINDLHDNNIGYTKNGITMIDGDANHCPPHNNVASNVDRAADNIDYVCPDLSIFDIKQMIDIYREMQNKQLPAHHDEFNMTDNMYQTLLKVYIEICEDVIKRAKKTMANYPESQRINKVNQLWYQLAKIKSLNTQHYNPSHKINP